MAPPPPPRHILPFPFSHLIAPPQPPRLPPRFTAHVRPLQILLLLSHGPCTVEHLLVKVKGTGSHPMRPRPLERRDADNYPMRRSALLCSEFEAGVLVWVSMRAARGLLLR
ncbi:hypothetical protein R3P38DRAFT_3238940 [Favolaschia claudopus]|uniref:Uncharacterized protein n=1 Tax=Favolaschia claudopus TaxID=2862362 RepID=A0AAV9Z9T3_9AGAR